MSTVYLRDEQSRTPIARVKCSTDEGRAAIIGLTIVVGLLLTTPCAWCAERSKASESAYESDITKANTSDGLTKADLAWHAQNTYGWDCEEVISLTGPNQQG